MEIRPRPLYQRQFLFIFFLFLTNFSLGQLVRFDDGSFSVGIRNGSNPNYNLATGKVFFVGTWDQSLSIKGIPLKFSSRISDEPLRAGRPTYFKLAYQPLKRDLRVTDSLLRGIDDLSLKQKFLLDSLAQLESKLSYFQGIEMMNTSFKKDSVGFPDSSSLETPNLPDSFSQIGNVSLSKVELTSIEESIVLVKQQMVLNDSLLIDLNSKYAEIQRPTRPSFLDGIRKFDIGMSSMSPSWGSTNAVPIQGLRIKGQYKQWVYDGSAGYSVTSQLFSNNAVDQLLNNTANGFNATQFFAVSQSRFVGSLNGSWGSDQKLKIGFENYYSGRTWKEFKTHTTDVQSLTGNGFVSYRLPFLKGLVIGGKLGTTYFDASDTIVSSMYERSMYQGKLDFQTGHTGTTYQLEIKEIGSNYTSWTQGIYLNGFKEMKGNINQRLGKRAQVGGFGSLMRFQEKNPLIGLNELTSLGINGTYNFMTKSFVYGNATWLSSDVSTRLDGSNYNYSVGLKLTEQYRDMVWENTGELTAFKMSTNDSVQRIDQYSLKSVFRYSKFYFGAKGMFQHYSGIERLTGSNYVTQLECGLGLNRFKISAIGSYLMSEQFGRDQGGTIDLSFSPSEFFTWKFSAQKWLKTDIAFFNTQENIVLSSWYVSTTMLIKFKKK